MAEAKKQAAEKPVPQPQYEAVQVREAGKQGDRKQWQVWLVTTCDGRLLAEKALGPPTHRSRAEELAKVEFSRRVLA